MKPMYFLSIALTAYGLACCDAPALTPDVQDGNPRHARQPAGARAEASNLITVPGGTYAIGRDDGPASQRPRHRVRLDTFHVDRTEVTNADFATFLNSLGLPVRGSFGQGMIGAQNADAQTLELLNTPYADRARPSMIELDDNEAEIVLVEGHFVPLAGRAAHPVTEVTWHGARAFCAWRGGALPTEAQWEAAARGQDDRLFPWGNEAPDRSRVVRGGSIGSTEPVGSRPAAASPHGALDMAGSLAEWTSSLKRPYPYRADDGREDPDNSGERTTRGGDYEYDRAAINYSTSFRDGFSNDPAHGHRHVGFRCAYAAQ